MTPENRIATTADLRQIADLRWRLRVDDATVTDRGAYDRFVADFIRICSEDWRPDEIIHWIAAHGDDVLAVMSIAIVRKLPSPENLRGRWGYLTNSYVLPHTRNAGIGRQLLATIETWARAEDLELLLVWPSQRAYPFYERAGYRRHPDPLVLRLRPE